MLVTAESSTVHAEMPGSRRVVCAPRKAEARIPPGNRKPRCKVAVRYMNSGCIVVYTMADIKKV